MFSPLTSAEACEKSIRWLWKGSCEKARKHMCVTDRHDITLAVQVALNPDTANKPNFPRAKKERNKECTIITITLILKMDLQGIYPAASHSQVGQPNHSAEKVVKTIFYRKE